MFLRLRLFSVLAAATALLVQSAPSRSAASEHANQASEARGAKAAPPAADFYVAPNGDDANPGTLDRPFATLAKARDAVRSHKAARPDRDVLVLLRGGVYRLERTVVFGPGDSAASGRIVVYAAKPGETPCLGSGVPLTGWKKVEQPPAGLAAPAHGRIWVARVPETVGRFRTLYDGTERLPRARSRGWVPTKKYGRVRTGDWRHRLEFPAGSLRQWPNLADVEVALVPQYPWVSNLLPLAAVDQSARVARTAVPATYPMGQVSFGRFPHGTLWVENILDALDEPGEWVLDFAKRKLYLWPKGDRPSASVVAPRLTELIRVEGRIDADGPEDAPVEGIVFRGLTFTQADRWPWEPDKVGLGLQHDWEMFDRPTAMVRFRGAERCAVEDCHLVNSGGAGIRLDLHCQKNRVTGNHIERLGGLGVLLAGYGPGTKDVNKDNVVARNHIHHVGQILWHSVGIFAWQSGSNQIVNNLIHHTPYTAIVVSGRIHWTPDGQGECSRTIRWGEIEAATGLPRRATWQQRERFLHGRRNLVARNEIHHTMQILGDGNCIYVSGTGAGNVVRENYLHDVDSTNVNANIRCDNDQHETLIEGNVIFRCCGEGFISKGNNTFRNNMIVDLRPATTSGLPSGHQRGYLVFPSDPVAGSLIQRNIFYSRTKGQKIVHEGRRGDARFRLRDCRADYNLYYCEADPEWGQRHLQTQRPHGIEEHSLAADPRWIDLKNGNLGLKPDSPVLRLGFRAIDLSKVGLRPKR